MQVSFSHCLPLILLNSTHHAHPILPFHFTHSLQSDRDSHPFNIPKTGQGLEEERFNLTQEKSRSDMTVYEQVQEIITRSVSHCSVYHINKQYNKEFLFDCLILFSTYFTNLLVHCILNMMNFMIFALHFFLISRTEFPFMVHGAVK